MLSLFKNAGPRRQAIRDGKLIDMYKKPFGRINKELDIDYSVAMTPAAYEQFITLSDTPAHRELSVERRWVNLLESLVEHYRNSEATEAVWDVNVVEPNGSLCAKPIRVLIEKDDDERDSLTFLLPEEVNPVAGPRPLKQQS